MGWNHQLGLSSVWITAKLQSPPLACWILSWNIPTDSAKQANRLTWLKLLGMYLIYVQIYLAAPQKIAKIIVLEAPFLVRNI